MVQLDSSGRLLEVGAHENSDSPYGTFDQGGNVWEWNETLIAISVRGLRGAYFDDLDYFLRAASFAYGTYPTVERPRYGFRVAQVPEPGPNIPTVPEWGLVAMVLLLLAAGTLMWGRRGMPVA